jgi:hypothetical protein
VSRIVAEEEMQEDAGWLNDGTLLHGNGTEYFNKDTR